MGMKLELRKLSCGYGDRVVVQNVSVSVQAGEVFCLLGPNGVGKTTLFKTILGFLKPAGGQVLLDGEDVRSFSKRRFAMLVGYVPQAHTPPFPFRVLDVVTMGRTARLGAFASPSRRDTILAEQALDRLGVGFLRDRIYTEISGGERQMVLIARALAQEPRFLMMDEPTSNLDFGNQVKVLQCISSLSKENGLGIIMTTHVPDHVFQLDGQVALLQRNNRYLQGEAREIITAENMMDTYGIHVHILHDHTIGGSYTSCVPVMK
ncbi:ABC transporter ATP-binding protein [Paenibacillus peoriae]|uniref:ABC transporter ATP-binding protein n=1 Tax=Paenibacillus peoriae TaxID=59893 RepID=UPI00026C5E95|nr:ABC transporter ATP-binding protein [Paenibacillus peoriae]MEC0181969.1 ABC transporter ATP-binding protein [Paenibacillus peoriae]